MSKWDDVVVGWGVGFVGRFSGRDKSKKSIASGCSETMANQDLEGKSIILPKPLLAGDGNLEQRTAQESLW